MCAVLSACAFLGSRAPLASVRGKAVGPVMQYLCDGCKAVGEPRGKSGATPAGWVCVVVDGRLMHMGLACEKARRGEPK